MSYHDDVLFAREHTLVSMPLATYCSRSTCNVLIHVGEPVMRFDGATFVHVSCPSSPLKTQAIHKMGEQTLRFD